MNRYFNDLDKPHIELAGLKLWVHSYQYPDANDYDDANWLNATAICSNRGAAVRVEGAFIRTTEIFAWQHAVETLAANSVGEARLDCVEPELAITLKGLPLGPVQVHIQITPDQLNQEHSFTFSIDQSSLGPLVLQCASLLRSFPIRGA